MNADAETLAVYALHADEYAAIRGGDVERRTLTRFLAALPSGARILDFGCGPGVHAERMIAEGFVVEGLDASPEFVALAKERGVDARLGLFDDLSATAAYDGIWASFSLLHAPRTAFPRHLSAIHRALVPGGRLGFATKLGEGDGRDSLGRFYTYFTEDELRVQFADAGFTITFSETGEGPGLSGQIDPFIVIDAHA